MAGSAASSVFRLPARRPDRCRRPPAPPASSGRRMTGSSPPPPADLESLRGRIDAIDRELLGLLNRRAEVATTIGALKRAEGSPAFRPEREAAVIDSLKTANAGPLPTESVAPIWREIMSACRSL